jgi:hypothetical protein
MLDKDDNATTKRLHLAEVLRKKQPKADMHRLGVRRTTIGGDLRNPVSEQRAMIVKLLRRACKSQRWRLGRHIHLTKMQTDIRSR